MQPPRMITPKLDQAAALNLTTWSRGSTPRSPVSIPPRVANTTSTIQEISNTRQLHPSPPPPSSAHACCPSVCCSDRGAEKAQAQAEAHAVEGAGEVVQQTVDKMVQASKLESLSVSEIFCAFVVECETLRLATPTMDMLLDVLSHMDNNGTVSFQGRRTAPICRGREGLGADAYVPYSLVIGDRLE
ncbi:hypothetical protein T492DRAFT_1118408 [Pavlovales sp. CCMP2436]|nr:hypothetical protein T492DRAFT_1118408 [Pavlovales sp. CCMP2436]